MSESARDELTVSDREFTVRKSLNTEQFQTLAVVLDVRSSRNESTRIQLSDVIPDEIPMDDVGFHPEYGGDHWTIDGHRVVFERSFDPGEEYTTIYGVRDLEADEADGLMTDPTIDIIEDPDDAIGDIGGIDDIVDEESSEAVREVISGDRDTLPGLEETDEEEAMTIEADDIEPPEEPIDADSPFADEPALGEPSEGDGEPPVAEDSDSLSGEPDEEPLDEPADADSILPEEDEPLLGEPDDEEPIPDEEPTDLAAEDTMADEEGSLLDQDEPLLGEPDEPEEPEEPGEPVDAEAPEEEPAVTGDDEPSLAEAAEESEPADELTVPVTGGVARVLAKELREGNVADEDRKLIKQELGSAGGSTETRIDHLQSRVSDLEAYSDALEAFLNENGRGREILDDLRDGMDSLEEDVSRIESRLAANAESIEDVRDELREVEDEVGELGGDVDRIDEQVARVDGVVQDLEDDLDHIGGVGDRTDSLEDELEEVRDHLEELDDFRRRLSSAFGGGGDDGGADG